MYTNISWSCDQFSTRALSYASLLSYKSPLRELARANVQGWCILTSEFAEERRVNDISYIYIFYKFGLYIATSLHEIKDTFDTQQNSEPSFELIITGNNVG